MEKESPIEHDCLILYYCFDAYVIGACVYAIRHRVYGTHHCVPQPAEAQASLSGYLPHEPRRCTVIYGRLLCVYGMYGTVCMAGWLYAGTWSS